jgi:D-3-phosphoglycerate dehydrogenase
MKLLVVADSYVTCSVFVGVFDGLSAQHEIRYAEVDESSTFSPATPSELRVHEYLGTPAELVRLLDGDDVLVVHGAPVTDAVLDASPSLRLVGCARGGPANVDLEAASSRGIAVVTAPGRNADAVADQTLAFMIMVARQFPKAQRTLLAADRTAIGTFEGRAFLGHDLNGHILGLVGYGHVGRRVAARALAFGMKVRAYDPFAEPDAGSGIERVSDLERLVADADFVSLHARATAATENLFDSKLFSAMKPGSYFINTARETLVDEDGLDAALASGHLAGAALDVSRTDGNTGIPRLLRHENVVMTPHIGGATHETLTRGVELVRDDVFRFAAGQPLLHVINREEIDSE